jgi:endothelin-converting enzyme/putative endopeptidase
MFFRKSLAVGIVLLAGICGFAQNSPSHSSVLNVEWLDRTVDPCVDLFTFSCGKWIQSNPIPPDQSSWGIYNKLQDDNLKQLRELLEATSAPSPARSSNAQKIGDYYASCMDETAIDALGIKPLQPELLRIEQLQAKKDLATVVASMIGEGTPFRIDSEQDFKDSSIVTAAVDQRGLGLPDRDYYLKQDQKSKDLRAAYVAHVQKMFELLGDKPELAATEAQSAMKIETALARGSMTRVDRRDPKKIYHFMSVAELEKLTPAFGWKEYFRQIGLSGISSLNVAVPEFFKTLNSQIEQQDLATWKSYLRWHAIHANATSLSSAVVNENFNFFGKTLQGKEQLPPRWKRCTNDVDDDLGEALGQVYVEKYFSPEAKKQVLEILQGIQKAMDADIHSLPWMSEETKRRALEKLQSMANKIGYPDKWRDYRQLEIKRGDHMGNSLRARRFEFDRDLAKIGKPVDRQEWQMTPPTVNAYYDPQKNDINFPAGILQPPMFDPKSDAAPNYGNAGSTIGHELTHGFDDEGRQFDAQGNLKDWWTTIDGKEFDRRASCISDQYSQYTVIDDIKINGKLTLGEDVADLGGTLLAYLAWKEATKDQKRESIDGFTPDQRFFIAYGQQWCSSNKDETKRLRAAIDPHSPDQYRANGVVSNMPEFREAFHCKLGQPMVRENACRVW